MWTDKVSPFGPLDRLDMSHVSRPLQQPNCGNLACEIGFNHIHRQLTHYSEAFASILTPLLLGAKFHFKGVVLVRPPPV